jgi:hypothetical protein
MEKAAMGRFFFLHPSRPGSVGKMTLGKQVKQEVDNGEYDEGNPNNSQQIFNHCSISLKALAEPPPQDTKSALSRRAGLAS